MKPWGELGCFFGWMMLAGKITATYNLIPGLLTRDRRRVTAQGQSMVVVRTGAA